MTKDTGQKKAQQMKTILKFISFILIIFFITPCLFSDILYLKNGGTVEGKIEDKGDHYVVNFPYGSAEFHKDTVLRIQYATEAEREQKEQKRTQEKIKKTLKEAAQKKTTTSKSVSPETTAAAAPPYLEIESSGQRILISRHAVKGKITIFDFYSPYCPPCKKVAPRLEQLAQSRDDIVVRKININRQSTRGIDWKSPVARQYHLKSVPYFIIYNTDGTRWLEGKPASKKVYSWL